MISKNSRRKTQPVERFEQYGFNGSKGIDVNASVEDPSKALLIKNLNIEPDGGLVLRKPVILKQVLPEVTVDGTVLQTDVLHIAYMFDNSHIFIVRKDALGKQYVGIFEKKALKKFQISLRSWDTGDEHILSPYESYSGNYIHLPYLDFTNLSIVNSSTSTILTGVAVNLIDPVFKINNKSYSHPDQTELFYPELYDYNSNVWRYRTLVISRYNFITFDFNISIITPEVSTIETSEQVVLNANLDADNPYAIRDVYGTTAPTVKAILPYLIGVNKGGVTELLADSTLENAVFTHTEHFPNTYSSNVASTVTLDSVPKCTIVSDSGNTDVGVNHFFDVDVFYANKVASEYSDEDFKIHSDRFISAELSMLYDHSVSDDNVSTTYALCLSEQVPGASHTNDTFFVKFTSSELLSASKTSSGFLKSTRHRVYFTLEGSGTPKIITGARLAQALSKLGTNVTPSQIYNKLASGYWYTDDKGNLVECSILTFDSPSNIVPGVPYNSYEYTTLAFNLDFKFLQANDASENLEVKTIDLRHTLINNPHYFIIC